MFDFDPNEPYNNLPPLPPADWDPNSDVRILQALIGAHAALAIQVCEM